MKKITFIVVIFLWVTNSIFAQSDWVRSGSEKSKISFEMPENPTIQERELNGIKVEIFGYKDAATVFGVVASDFSDIGLDFTYSDPSEYYEQMKEASLVTGDAILVSEQSVAYQKMLGKEIVYTQLVGKHEYTYYKRFFFRKKFIYQAAIGGPTRMKQFLVDKKNIFFNTLEFID
ncbi:hypothetical protein [Labilibaculum sp.]|uniref:hypothetical protein n=1 Tax=Labilibaculum sp. TaxID=2060723 RepID=UPI00356ACA98